MLMILMQFVVVGAGVGFVVAASDKAYRLELILPEADAATCFRTATVMRSSKHAQYLVDRVVD
jgi:hypothetical protein